MVAADAPGDASVPTPRAPSGLHTPRLATAVAAGPPSTAEPGPPTDIPRTDGIACLLMLGLILGMAFIPDDTHKFY